MKNKEEILNKINELKAERKHMLGVLKVFERANRKRELKEIRRLITLLLSETDNSKIKEIEQQILFCQALSWREYKKFFIKY